MLTERQARIGKLARSNKARLSTDDFLNGLSGALGRPMSSDSLLAISESDALRIAHRYGYQKTVIRAANTYRDLQSQSGLAAIGIKIEKLRHQLQNESAILLPSHFELCVRIETNEVLNHFKAVLKFDCDTLMLASPAGEDGLMLDWNPDDREETYEFAVWGESWTGALY